MIVNATEGTRSATIEHTYAGTTDTINQARNDLVEWLFENGLPQVTADAQLVVSELTSNAIEASPDQPYRVSARLEADVVCIRVSNRSTAELPSPDDWSPESVLAPQGRGLLIVKALASSVDIDQTDTETTVSAHLSIVRDD